MQKITRCGHSNEFHSVQVNYKKMYIHDTFQWKYDKFNTLLTMADKTYCIHFLYMQMKE